MKTETNDETMTPRDKFAAVALPEFLRIRHQTTDLRTLTDDNAREIADLSYRMADAMIARRSSAQPNKKLTEPATR